jgi:hypothetical protein
MRNGSIHTIPDLHTLSAMGVDGNSIKKVTDWQLKQYPKGADIPAQ